MHCSTACRRASSGSSRPRTAVLAACVLCVRLSGPVAWADTIEGRVGKSYWARPALSETSVEFHREVTLRTRVGVRDKTRISIVGIRPGGPWPPSDPVYEVSFDDGTRAFIDAHDFERRLYHELGSNEFSVSPQFEPPLGRGVQSSAPVRTREHLHRRSRRDVGTHP